VSFAVLQIFSSRFCRPFPEKAIGKGRTGESCTGSEFNLEVQVTVSLHSQGDRMENYWLFRQKIQFFPYLNFWPSVLVFGRSVLVRFVRWFIWLDRLKHSGKVEINEEKSTDRKERR